MSKLQIGRKYNASKYEQNLKGAKMPKKSWAKGRERQYNINVGKETHELLSKLAEESGMTMKDFIFLALTRYVNRNNDD